MVECRWVGQEWELWDCSRFVNDFRQLTFRIVDTKGYHAHTIRNLDAPRLILFPSGSATADAEMIMNELPLSQRVIKLSRSKGYKI